MTATDEQGPTTEEIRNDPAIRFWAYGLDAPVYRLVVWCFVVGSACHLWLADAWQLEWLGADIFYVAGLAFLAWRGSLAGWCLSALGLLIPLVFHRDQLTQSMFLLLVAVAGIVATGRAAWRSVYGNSSGDDDGHRPTLHAFTRSVQWLTILVYGFAFLHKLNADFLDPEYSCAVYGLREITAYWQLPPIELSANWAIAAPLAVLLAEGSVAALHLLRYRRIAWTVATAFHIFLTFTMAPAFVFVMAVGHAAFATPADLKSLGRTLDRHRWGLAAWAGTATAISIGMHGALPEPTMIPREFALWGLLGLLVTTYPPWRRGAWRRRDPYRTGSHFARWVPALFAVTFALNGLTPYLGVQFQHTAAMVSNLRIDRGCWNSLVFPESMRLRDEYIRVEEVYFGRPGRDPAYEKIVRRQLWSPPQFRQMRRNWCSPSNRPFYMRGTYMGEAFEIEDLCAGEPLPFGEFRPFGIPIFGDFLRFQKNLKRDCPQTCIH